MTDKEITVAIKKQMDKIVKICKENGIDYITLSYRNDLDYEAVMFNNEYFNEFVEHKINYTKIKEKTI